MYPPPYHQTEDQNEMLKVIKHYPLAMVVSVLNGGSVINANKQLIITNKERIVAFMTDLLK